MCIHMNGVDLCLNIITNGLCMFHTHARVLRNVYTI
jgi:hypothetical protein